MKTAEKINLILRDAQGKPFMVKVNIGSNIDIDIYLVVLLVFKVIKE